MHGTKAPIVSISRSLLLGGLSLVSASFANIALADDKLHHGLDLTLEPLTGELRASDSILVSGREKLAIKLAPGLSIDAIKVDDQTISAEQTGGVTWIELPSNGDHQVDVTYGGVVQQDTAQRGLSPLVAEAGAFLPYGIGWLANGGAEDDRVTYDLRIDVPLPFKAVATGSLVEEQEIDGRYRATFSAEQPTEPPSVFAGDYQIEERRHGDLRLRTYFPKDAQDLADNYLDQAALYIDRFEQTIGDYPYDGFAMVSASLPVGLGFPGLTYFSSQILRMPFMQTRSLAHEILHNWWANGVFVDYGEGNWSEGLTTYMADYGLAEASGDDAAWEMRLGWLRDYAALPAERDRPVSAFRSKGHTADQVIGYNKTAMIFHMLEQELGEDAFNAGLRSFWEKHRFTPAGWSDLQTSFETAGGRKLDGFFGYWLTETGAPSLTLDVAEIEERDGGYAVDLEVSSDVSSVDLLVPVQVETAEGVQQRTIRLADGKAKAALAFGEKPLSVGIDQGHDLFRRLAPGEAPPILRDVTLNAETLTVIAADGDDDAVQIAETLAARTLDTGLRRVDGGAAAVGTSPLMLIGLADDLAPVLANAGIETVPPSLKGKGTARGWVAARDGAPPAFVVEADDKAALDALLRPLPHYGRQSFLVFEGGRAIEKGVWPSGDNALTKRFQ